jgi:hypothetical protein
LCISAKSVSCGGLHGRVQQPHRKTRPSEARNYLREENERGAEINTSAAPELFIYLMLRARVHSAVEISNLISTAIHHIAGNFFTGAPGIGGAPRESSLSVSRSLKSGGEKGSIPVTPARSLAPEQKRAPPGRYAARVCGYFKLLSAIRGIEFGAKREFLMQHRRAARKLTKKRLSRSLQGANI